MPTDQRRKALGLLLEIESIPEDQMMVGGNPRKFSPNEEGALWLADRILAWADTNNRDVRWVVDRVTNPDNFARMMPSEMSSPDYVEGFNDGQRHVINLIGSLLEARGLDRYPSI